MGRGNRRRRAGMWIAGLAVIAAIAATYHLTRPPELVWWTSPRLCDTDRHVSVLIPGGWKVVLPAHSGTYGALFSLAAQADHRPKFLRWIIPHRQEHGSVVIDIEILGVHDLADEDLNTAISYYPTASSRFAHRSIQYGDGCMDATVFYERADMRAFNATYKQVCNSLRFE